jgi:carboxypeptidase C (cathepsin A)
VIFVWNGGPGANSTTVHLIGFGPWRLRTPEDAAQPTPVTPGLYENDATWLAFADLVFVDPVGTGFARPTTSENGEAFYNTLGDIASTAEFIRVFRLRFDLQDAPIFLAGESYGAWRAAGAAEILDKRGVPIAGVLLISGGLGMGQGAPNAIRTALFVPVRTAAALYHQRLAPQLQRDPAATLEEVKLWALNVYSPAWEKQAALSDAERDQIIGDLARYTGVPASSVDREKLSMTSRQFLTALLQDRNASLGRYDMRVVRTEAGERSDDDLSRDQITMRYLRDDLGFKSDLAYQGVETGWSPTPDNEASQGPAMRWVWNQGEAALTSGTDAAVQANQATAGSGDGPPGGSQPWMLRAMKRNPKLKLFVAAGAYDSLNSHALNTWIIDSAGSEIARNTTLKCYPAGHIMYDTKAARFSLRDDVEAFVKMACD